MRRAAGIADREIASLEGGDLILEARERVARLFPFIPPSRPAGIGYLDGRQGLQRRGRPQDLLLSEHLHDDDEFLRRYHDGEQLFLSRESRLSAAAQGWGFWDLGPTSLGSPRRIAIGLALALARQCALAARRFRLVVQAERRFDLQSIDDVRHLLSLPPRPVAAPETWDAVLDQLEGREVPEIYWITSRSMVPALRGERAVEPLLPETVAIFVLDAHRVELLVRGRGRRGSWRSVGDVSMEERRWFPPPRPGI